MDPLGLVLLSLPHYLLLGSILICTILLLSIIILLPFLLTVMGIILGFRALGVWGLGFIITVE